jgi:hypothetical protein
MGENNKHNKSIKKDLTKKYKPDKSFILLTNPGDNHPLMTHDNEIYGLSTDFPKNVFKNGGRKKTIRKKKYRVNNKNKKKKRTVKRKIQKK